MNRHDPDLARRLYRRAPAPPAIQLEHLVDMGAALAAACAAVVRDPTLTSLDGLLASLAGATEAVRHLRRKLAESEARDACH